ncbi:hypothetical protein METH_16245 [Leisingera methylohalidivorans DSM 14336]|uniref:Uncharacterized protein n=1 Tax=Leisingera methylohalidivorans DSM 14336 TaxID=999552 RepID=V9VZ27_9RHOB|nr:hypothetical protein METH_16245 [Leisingera methylohalidivorans DSM 14336]
MEFRTGSIFDAAPLVYGRSGLAAAIGWPTGTLQGGAPVAAMPLAASSP